MQSQGRRVGRGGNVPKGGFVDRLVDFFVRLFDTSDFPARWSCGRWAPELGWLHIVADLLIFGAYTAIPASLAVVVMRRRDLPLRPIFWLFVAFILSCGLTHLVEAVLFYEPVYRFSGLMKAITAIVSCATVVALIRVMPEALHLPGVRAANDALRGEVARRALVEADLEKARQELEQRSSQLVLREHRVRSALESARAGTVRWEVDSGRMIWEQGLRERLLAVGFHAPESADWRGLMSEADFAAFRDAADRAARAGRRLDIALTLADGARSLGARFVGRADPDVAGQPRTFTGMITLVDA
jgi:hypothetical protein